MFFLGRLGLGANPLVEFFPCGRFHSNNLDQIAKRPALVFGQRVLNVEPSIDAFREPWSLDTRFDHVVGQEFRGRSDLHFLVPNPVDAGPDFPVGESHYDGKR
jgi:hypothetical protein